MFSQPQASRTVQSHLRIVPPRLLVIPKLDTLDYGTFAGEVDSMVSSARPYPVLNSKLLGRAVPEVDDDPVEENGIATYP